MARRIVAHKRHGSFNYNSDFLGLRSLRLCCGMFIFKNYVLLIHARPDNDPASSIYYQHQRLGNLSSSSFGERITRFFCYHALGSIFLLHATRDNVFSSFKVSCGLIHKFANIQKNYGLVSLAKMSNVLNIREHIPNKTSHALWVGFGSLILTTLLLFNILKSLGYDRLSYVSLILSVQLFLCMALFLTIRGLRILGKTTTIPTYRFILSYIVFGVPIIAGAVFQVSLFV